MCLIGATFPSRQLPFKRARETDPQVGPPGALLRETDRLALTLAATYDGRVKSIDAQRAKSPVVRRGSPLLAALFPAVLCAGCVPFFPSPPAELFTAPLIVNGQPIGSAIIDTGGGYELILSDRFGLPIAGSVDVLSFGGKSFVDVTGGFDYTVGGVSDHADFALIGTTICGCNGLGFHFFRKTGRVLALDFETMEASFTRTVPLDAVIIPFAGPPDSLAAFDTSFIDVTVSTGGVTRDVVALLDTGTNASVMRRGIVPNGSPLTPHQTEVLITQPQLGTIAATARLFDTPGLPDLILGTDAMQAWSNKWYFFFAATGGMIVVPFETVEDQAGVLAKRRSAAPVMPVIMSYPR